MFSLKTVITALKYLFCFFVLGFIFAWVFWVLLGHDLYINPSYDLRKDFFDVLCGSYTIVALVIAIIQIAEIKSRQQDIDTELKRQRNIDNVIRISKINGNIEEIQTLIIEDGDYKHANHMIGILKDELHLCRSICPLKESEININLLDINAVQHSIQNARVSTTNPIDKEYVGTVLETSRDILVYIIEFCRNNS